MLQWNVFFFFSNNKTSTWPHTLSRNSAAGWQQKMQSGGRRSTDTFPWYYKDGSALAESEQRLGHISEEMSSCRFADQFQRSQAETRKDLSDLSHNVFLNYSSPSGCIVGGLQSANCPYQTRKVICSNHVPLNGII